MKYGETDRPVLVIGYGNDLRGDDGAGPAAARRLARRLPSDLASIVTVHQLLPELAEPVSRAKLAIFIDADAQLAPGVVNARNLTPSPTSNGTLGHHLDPENILCLARDLYGRAPQAQLYSIGGETFAYKQTLSPRIQRALPGLVRDVVTTVLRISRELEVCHA